MRDQKSRIRDLGSEIKDQRSRIRDQGSEFKDQRSEIKVSMINKDQKSGIKDHAS